MTAAHKPSLSAGIRLSVSRGEIAADEAVRRLLDAGDHDGRQDCSVSCPECGDAFLRSNTGRWNTCSDRCQCLWNRAIFDLDDGRTIVKISELTAERSADLLGAAGFGMVGLGAPGTGKVTPS